MQSDGDAITLTSFLSLSMYPETDGWMEMLYLTVESWTVLHLYDKSRGPPIVQAGVES